MAMLRDGVRVAAMGDPVREHGRVTVPIDVELRVSLRVADDREYEIGWIGKPADLPDLLRAVADRIEAQRR